MTDFHLEASSEITCSRKSRLSSGYFVSHGEEKVELEFSDAEPIGTLSYEDEMFTITSTGTLGRKWELTRGDSKLVAERRGLRSSVAVSIGNERYELSRKHLLGNTFELMQEHRLIAVFEKPALISGRSRIVINSADLDLFELAFLFWLCENIRRRTTKAWS